MSFRYHLVSLAAVLTALAVGIVVGTTSIAASPATTAVAPVVADTTGEQFAQHTASRLIKGTLTDQRVLLLLAPDVPAGAPRTVVDALRAAGATVTGQVRLLPTLLDPSGAATVAGVVRGVAPAGLALPPGALEGAGAELAASLVTSDQGADLSPTPASKVLGAFTGADLLDLDGTPSSTRATLVLLLSGPARGPALATLATGFQARVGTVVAATPAAAYGRGVVAVLRGHSSGTSDVDGLGTAEALVATVLALQEQAGGQSGHYGVGPKASGVVPDLG